MQVEFEDRCDTSIQGIVAGVIPWQMASSFCHDCCFLLIPIKLFAGKIVSEMPYDVSSTTLNTTIATSQTNIWCWLRGTVVEHWSLTGLCSTCS